MRTLEGEHFLQLVEQKKSEKHALTGLAESKHAMNCLWRPRGQELRAVSSSWKQLLAKKQQGNKAFNPTAPRKWLLLTTRENAKLWMRTTA